MAQDRDRILALQQRTFDFTCGVVNAYPKGLRFDDASKVMWYQLLKAASSVTFNLEEADAASSDNDFLAKMRITLREAKESRKVIKVITTCKLANWREVGKFEDEARQLSLIFAKIIVNKRRGMN
jgi:four helix bundle protein